MFLFFRQAFATINRPGRLHAPVMLDNKLGRWHEVPRHIKHQYYRTSTTAYNRNGAAFLTYTAVNNNVFDSDGEIIELPNNAIPIEARHTVFELYTMEQYNILPTPPAPPTSRIQSVQQVDGPNMAGSDGSVHPVKGDRACAYCVQYNGIRYGGRQRYPPSQFSTSYRAELEGAYNTLRIADEVDAPDGIDQWIDNSEAVNSLNKELYTAQQMLAPEADIILASHKLRNDRKKRTNIAWLRSHQDDHKSRDECDPNAQMNVDMDDESKKARVDDDITYDQPLPGSGALLTIGDSRVTTKYAEQIRDAILAEDHLNFFLNKYKYLKQSHYDIIYWRGIGEARKGLTTTQNINIFKFMNGWLNTGRQQGLFGKTPECASCGWEEETQLHMYQCHHPEARRTRKQAFQQLAKYYHSHRTSTVVYVPFIKLCMEACTQNMYESHEITNPIIKAAIDKQRTLGKDFIVRGYLVPEWLEAIAAYNGDKPELQMRHLFRGLWTILFAQIWETRNNIKHGNTSIVDKIEREQLITELHEWKRNSGNRLSSGQQYLIDYNIHDLTQWTTTGLKSTVELLIQAAKNFRQAIQNQQHLITQYFSPLPTMSNDQ